MPPGLNSVIFLASRTDSDVWKWGADMLRALEPSNYDTPQMKAFMRKLLARRVAAAEEMKSERRQQSK